MRAGFCWRSYVLRAYCDTNMIIAESKGKISHPYLQFIMGHKGDIEARYSTNKGMPPPDMIEDMRKCYKECEPFLSTATQPKCIFINSTSIKFFYYLQQKYRKLLKTNITKVFNSAEFSFCG
ncbi:MAG: hypothetical protein RMI04_04160 [Thermofilaceae archaeon]|nr:hypothetical protein [Thermofilaceae archaeon]